MRDGRRFALLAWAVVAVGTGVACGGSTASIAGGDDGGSPGADGAADSPAPASTTDCTTIDAGGGPGGGPNAAAGPTDPGVQDTVRGTNGTFVDSCDASGNLVDYLCETKTTCGPGPNPECTTSATGKVVSQNVDCSGHCSGGRCDSRCPAIGQAIDFVSVDPSSGDATIHDDGDGRTFACTLAFQAPNLAFDCKTGPQAGTKASIVSLGLHGEYCTGKDFGGFGVKFDGVGGPGTEACAYECSVP